MYELVSFVGGEQDATREEGVLISHEKKAADTTAVHSDVGVVGTSCANGTRASPLVRASAIALTLSSG
jgi:hypothetical protein